MRGGFSHLATIPMIQAAGKNSGALDEATAWLAMLKEGHACNCAACVGYRTQLSCEARSIRHRYSPPSTH